MDIPLYGNKRGASEYNLFNIDDGDDFPFNDDYLEVMDSEVSDIPVDWGMPDTSSRLHPTYFAKCLTKAIDTDYGRKMDHPSNGVSIMGCLRPASADEVPDTYNEDSDGCNSDIEDKEFLSLNSESDRSSTSSTFYRLEVMRIELFSVYGVQSVISVEDFQDAEPDILVDCTSETDILIQSTSDILEHFNESGYCLDRKALCKKKGLQVERANLIGVDSLGIDVRVFCGTEAQTHRFPFKYPVKSLDDTVKQIKRLLPSKSHRKRRKREGYGLRRQY